MYDLALVSAVRVQIENKNHAMDAVLKNILLHAYAKCEPNQAISLWPKLISQNELDLKLYATILTACTNTQNLQLGIQVNFSNTDKYAIDVIVCIATQRTQCT
jgi:hypothetical protein